MCDGRPAANVEMVLLKDAYQTMCKKLSMDHFEGTNYSTMKVRRSAQVLSCTMDGLSHEVTANALKYAIQHCFAGAHFFAPSLQLCEKRDRWVGICISILGSTKTQLRNMLITLYIMGWIYDGWMLVPMPMGMFPRAVESFKYTYLPFASMLHDLCDKRGNSIKVRTIN